MEEVAVGAVTRDCDCDCDCEGADGWFNAGAGRASPRAGLKLSRCASRVPPAELVLVDWGEAVEPLRPLPCDWSGGLSCGF